jgi:hypothetical protein
LNVESGNSARRLGTGGAANSKFLASLGMTGLGKGESEIVVEVGGNGIWVGASK